MTDIPGSTFHIYHQSINEKISYAQSLLALSNLLTASYRYRPTYVYLIERKWIKSIFSFQVFRSLYMSSSFHPQYNCSNAHSIKITMQTPRDKSWICSGKNVKKFRFGVMLTNCQATSSNEGWDVPLWEHSPNTAWGATCLFFTDIDCWKYSLALFNTHSYENKFIFSKHFSKLMKLGVIKLRYMMMSETFMTTFF